MKIIYSRQGYDSSYGDSPKRKKDEQAELVKLFRSIIPGDFVKVLENSIQRIIEAELSSILGARPYQRVENRTNNRNGCRTLKDPPAPSGSYPARVFGRLDQWQDLSLSAFGKDQGNPKKTMPVESSKKK